MIFLRDHITYYFDDTVLNVYEYMNSYIHNKLYDLLLISLKRKGFEKIQHSINSQQTRNRRELPQPDEKGVFKRSMAKLNGNMENISS